MWAGYLALVNQQAVANGNKPLGFINPALYTIGLSSSYDTDFHDVTSGSNGYAATTGYDLATGWGSPNGAALIAALNGNAPPPSFSISSSPATVSVAQGSAGTPTITSTVTGGFDSAISLSATGQPAGVTVGFNPTSITGAGTSVMTITVAHNHSHWHLQNYCHGNRWRHNQNRFGHSEGNEGARQLLPQCVTHVIYSF